VYYSPLTKIAQGIDPSAFNVTEIMRPRILTFLVITWNMGGEEPSSAINLSKLLGVCEKEAP